VFKFHYSVKILTKLVKQDILLFMKTMQAAKAKAQFSSVLKDVMAGGEVALTYGKKQETVAVIIPFEDWKKNQKRVLGTLKEKMTVTFSDDWKVTDEELLYNS